MRGFTATCPTTANASPCRPVCSRTHTPRIRSHTLTSQTTPAGNPPAAQLGCCEFKGHSIRQTYSPGTACKNHPWSSWCCPTVIRDAGRIVVDFGGAKKWKYSTGTGCVCACVRACVCACESVPCLCVLCGSSNSGGSGSGSNNSKRLRALCGAARDNKVVSHRGRRGQQRERPKCRCRVGQSAARPNGEQQEGGREHAIRASRGRERRGGGGRGGRLPGR